MKNFGFYDIIKIQIQLMTNLCKIRLILLITFLTSTLRSRIFEEYDSIIRKQIYIYSSLKNIKFRKN